MALPHFHVLRTPVCWVSYFLGQLHAVCSVWRFSGTGFPLRWRLCYKNLWTILTSLCKFITCTESQSWPTTLPWQAFFVIVDILPPSIHHAPSTEHVHFHCGSGSSYERKRPSYYAESESYAIRLRKTVSSQQNMHPSWCAPPLVWASPPTELPVRMRESAQFWVLSTLYC